MKDNLCISYTHCKNKMAGTRMPITTMNKLFEKSIHEEDLSQLNEVLFRLCSSGEIYSFGIYKNRDDQDKLQEITIILRRSPQGYIIVCVYTRQKNRFVKTNCKELGVKVVLEDLARKEYDILMEDPHPKDSIANINDIRTHSILEGEDVEYLFSTQDIITRYLAAKESDSRPASKGGKKSKKRSRRARSKQSRRFRRFI